MNEQYGPEISEQTLTDSFLTGPGQYLVRKLMVEMAKTPPFKTLFGELKFAKTGDESSGLAQSQRWADYPRFDWSVRQLPTINVFEADPENKESSNAFLNGAVSIQVFWPPKLKRSSLARVPATFRGAVLNFFESEHITRLLDEHVSIQRIEKVPGLNELGKVITWSPNTEGIVESEMVPITMFNVRYRIDLRSWYRFLELDHRTKDQPFDRPLSGLESVQGEYQGTYPKANDVKVRVPEKIIVQP